MLLLKMLAIAGIIGMIVFYLMSVFTDSEDDGLTNQFGRWLYLACGVIFISSVAINVLSIFLPIINPIGISLVIGGSCLLFQDRIKVIGTNEIWIGQNTWITRTVENRSMRLQFTGGVNVLLHGEVLVKKITDEVHVYDLEIKNVECLDGVPMSAKLSYQISPDFSNFQALTRLDQIETERIKKAKKLFDAAIINLVSIVFSGNNQETIKKNRKKINNDIKDHVFTANFLNPQEIHTGYKIKSLIVSDTDDTEEIRKSNEQFYVSKGQGKAVQELLKSLEIDSGSLTPKEKKKLMEGLLATVQANSGKRQIKDVNVRIDGDDLSSEAKSRITAEAIESA